MSSRKKYFKSFQGTKTISPKNKIFFSNSHHYDDFIISSFRFSFSEGFADISEDYTIFRKQQRKLKRVRMFRFLLI